MNRGGIGGRRVAEDVQGRDGEGAGRGREMADGKPVTTRVRATAKPAESIDVLASPSTDVAVITSPADSTPANVAVNVAVPVASVVTMLEPMGIVPAASLKKFSV